MSYEIGWAAINLEMPKRVPHFFIGNADTRILLRGERAFYNEVYEELVLAALMSRGWKGDSQRQGGRH